MVTEWPRVRVGAVSDSISETHALRNDALIFLNTSDVLRGKILHHSYSRVKGWPGQAKKSIRREDILFSEIRPANGRYAYVDVEASDYVVSTKLMVIRARTSVLPRFLYHFLTNRRTTDWLQELAESRSGTFPQITFDQVAELELTLPPGKIQRAIASFLDALDAKVEVNVRLNETLEAMARAIFKSWFVDFEPVRARAEGRQPAGMDAETAALFPDSFHESATGKIPKGWRLEVLGGVLSELECGGRPKGGVSGYTSGVPSIGAESIVALGQFDYSKTKYVPQAFFDRLKRGHVQNRDVLLYKDGGRPGEFEPHVTMFGDGFPFETCAINEHVYRLRAREEFGQNLLFFSLSSESVMEEMRVKGTGVAIPGLNSTQMKSLTTLVPTGEVARAFDALVEPLIARILTACTDSRALATLRDALLPKLLSGEVRVNDAESILSGPA